MTRLYEGTSASDTFDGRCVGHRLKVNFPPSWQKEFQICSLKMKTHLEISNCKRNQAILYCLLTISSNFPLFHLLSILSGSATEVFSVNQVLQTVEPDHYFCTMMECLKCIFRGKTVVDVCRIQTCIIIKLFHKLV